MAAKRAVKYSDAIIAVSQQTKNELVEQLGADPEKVFVLEHTIDTIFRDLGKPRARLLDSSGP